MGKERATDVDVRHISPDADAETLATMRYLAFKLFALCDEPQPRVISWRHQFTETQIILASLIREFRTLAAEGRQFTTLCQGCNQVVCCVPDDDNPHVLHYECVNCGRSERLSTLTPEE